MKLATVLNAKVEVWPSPEIFLKCLRVGLFVVLSLLLMDAPLAGQTLQPTRAVDVQICASFLGIGGCETLETERISRSFTVSKLNRKLFGRTWGTASHCTHVDPLEMECERSVSASTDPLWDRIIWGLSDEFILSYGRWGTAQDGPGHFRSPRGIDISHRTDDEHVIFVADTYNSRIVVLLLHSDTQQVDWLGEIDGAASGQSLRMPNDVAWDHAGTWSRSDDRIFIADAGNDRIVVYAVNVNSTAGTMSATYLTNFGTSGSGVGELDNPMGIAVRSYKVGSSLFTDVYAADTRNERVTRWDFDGPSPTAIARPAAAPITGSRPIGISVDHYGDVFVADFDMERMRKYRGTDLTLLQEYGGASGWSGGNFAGPTNLHVIYHNDQDAGGNLVSKGLPYIQTTEEWTDNTGGQLHRLGVDATNLAAVGSGCGRSLEFDLTGHGSHQTKVLNGPGGASRVFLWASATSGHQSVYWDGRDAAGNPMPNGTYTLSIVHESAYDYDDGSPRTSQTTFSYNCSFYVAASVPGWVTAKAWYPLNGSATHTANGWQWDIRPEGGNWSLWSNSQNTGWIAYAGIYNLDWQLTATSTTGGGTNYDIESTSVCIAPSGCGPAVQITQADLSTARPPPADPGPRSEAGPLHFGSGVWIGIGRGGGGEAARLYSFGGQHEVAFDSVDWPNLLETDSVDWITTGGSLIGNLRIKSKRLEYARGIDAYAIEGVLPAGKTASAIDIALVADPDIGEPHDDQLVVDNDRSLVWVTDSDSLYVGYLILSPTGVDRARVIQFGSGLPSETRSKSAAFGELKSAERTSEQPGDVRFILTGSQAQVATDGSFARHYVVLRAEGHQELLSLAAKATTDAAKIISRLGKANFSIGSCAGGNCPAVPTEFALSQRLPGGDVITSGVMSIRAGSILASQRRSLSQAQISQRIREDGIQAVDFDVPEQASLSIRIYGRSGNLVRTLVDEGVAPGRYSYRWNGMDENGRKASPGVYFAVMAAPGFEGKTKLIVVR